MQVWLIARFVGTIHNRRSWRRWSEVLGRKVLYHNIVSILYIASRIAQIVVENDIAGERETGRGRENDDDECNNDTVCHAAVLPLVMMILVQCGTEDLSPTITKRKSSHCGCIVAITTVRIIESMDGGALIFARCRVVASDTTAIEIVHPLFYILRVLLVDFLLCFSFFQRLTMIFSLRTCIHSFPRACFCLQMPAPAGPHLYSLTTSNIHRRERESVVGRALAGYRKGNKLY
jgi:hypothetical protein